MASSVGTAVTAYSTLDWLQIFGLGALVGMFGQGTRTIVGMKKLGDAAADSPASVSDLIIVSRLLISLAIGAVAGCAAAIGIVDPTRPIPLAAILGIATAGYSGADFIEGFISRSLGTPDAPAGQPMVGLDMAGGNGNGDANGHR